MGRLTILDPGRKLRGNGAQAASGGVLILQTELKSHFLVEFFHDGNMCVEVSRGASRDVAARGLERTAEEGIFANTILKDVAQSRLLQ